MHQIYPVLSAEGGGAARTERGPAGDAGGGGDAGAGGGAEGAGDAAERLAALYAYPGGQDRPWVRANMIASVDGAATIGGRSGALGGPADRKLLQVLRALADVILVGAGTARAEGYGPARAVPALAALRRDRPATAPIAVVSARLDLDPRAPLLVEAPAEARTIVVTTPSAPRSQQAAIARHAELIVAESDQLTAGRVIDELAARGHARILAEGGPSLLAQIAEAGRLDELCLTISPVLAGGQGRRILSGTPLGDQQPGTPEPLRLAHVLADGDYLFCRYVRTV